MRGLASILLVFALAVALISLTAAYSSAREHSLQTSSYALELERTYYSKLDLTHSVTQALARGAGEGNSREERAENAAGKLAELGNYLQEHKNTELWCGILSDEELRDLPERISEAKKPIRCERCWGVEEKAVVFQTFPEKKARLVNRCLSFLDVDVVSKKVGVSKGGLAITQDAEVLANQFSGSFVFGISVYDGITGIGSVAILPEGTWVSYVEGAIEP